MVRDSNFGHQLLLPPANWCPMFASRTTQALIGTLFAAPVVGPEAITAATLVALAVCPLILLMLPGQRHWRYRRTEAEEWLATGRARPDSPLSAKLIQ